MNKEELKVLKDKLPRGYRDEIAEKTGFHISYVDHVFSGRRENQLIIDAAFEILKKEEEKKAKQQELLKNKN